MLGMSQQQLADIAKVAKKTLVDFEGSNRTPYPRTLSAIEAVLEAAGVDFIPENGGGAGVRLKNRSVSRDAS
jgi:transcriptional regulator with XRE-family HTH domain